jgi:hypothetical protein
MPVHDWSRVTAGIFHHFHGAWIFALAESLNHGILPRRFYALAKSTREDTLPGQRIQDRLVIRHASDDRMVAVIEIVSQANKSNSNALNLFVRKSIEFLGRGIHLLIVDVQPPTRRDPHGIHGAIWAALGEAEYEAPPDKPLTLVSYAAGNIKTAYIEPFAVGDALADMPLFLDEEHYVRVPLETTSVEAWNDVPERWRSVIKA